MADSRPSLPLARWPEVEALLATIWDLAPAERTHHLAAATAHDPALRRAVEELLAAEADAPAFLDAGVAALALPTDGDDPEPASGHLAAALVGRRLGPWRLERVIGEGGMGIVFLAERDDGAFAQRAAVKLLRTTVPDRALHARLRAERQILARLSHPHVAHVLDGGTTPQGQPYLVMEYVEGEPLDRWCDRRRLPVADRLRLFVLVARAVQHAHRNLVVHRDLKPGNILVTDDGVPKLLDFGIASLLDDAETGAATRTGRRWLTPGYAAPEQVRGEPVTTAADVYALGVLLYELLTGHRPHGARGDGAYEIGRAVCEDDPAPPSAAVTRVDEHASGEPVTPETVSRARATEPTRLRRQLGGDLDAIVLTALRREPAARYGSAEALAEDVERHLAGMPVQARGSSLGYRTRRLLRRHWVPATALAAVTMLSVGSAVVTTRLRAAAEVERDRARIAAGEAARDARTAEQATAFLAELFRGSNPNATQGDELTARELLDRGAERLGTALAGEPAVRAELLQTIGSSYAGLGRYEQAESLLVRAVALRERVHGPTDARVATALRRLGDARRSGRRFAAADTALRQAYAILLAQPALDDTAHAGLLQSLSLVTRDLGGTDSAVVLARRALTLRRQAGDTSGAAYRGTIGTLAFAHRAAGALDSAEVAYVELVRHEREAGIPDRSGFAALLNNLAYLRKTRGDHAAAVRDYEEALQHTRAVYGDGHPNTLMVWGNLAVTFDEAGRYDEAEAALRGQIAAAAAHWPAGHWRVGSRHRSYAIFLLRRDRMADALAELRAAERSYVATLGAEHDWTLGARAWTALALAYLGREAEAEALRPSISEAFLRAHRNPDAATRADLERMLRRFEQRGPASFAVLVRRALGQSPG